MTRCSKRIGLRQCVRKCEFGDKCYQHQTSSNNSHEFSEKYALIGSYIKDRKDFMNFLLSLPKELDKNRTILQIMKYGNMVLPLMFFVNGKPKIFENYEEAHSFVKENYKLDITPYVVSYIQKNGTHTGDPRGKDSISPYGFNYYKTKSTLPDTPSAPIITLYSPISDDEDIFLEAAILNEIVKFNPLLQSVLKRGDYIFNSYSTNKGNRGILLWDGRKVVPLDNFEQDGGKIPREFKILTEFPFGYFTHLKDDMGIRSRNRSKVQYIDLYPYIEQAIDNLDGGKSYIDVKENFNGKERIIRIDLQGDADLTPGDIEGNLADLYFITGDIFRDDERGVVIDDLRFHQYEEIDEEDLEEG